MAMNTHRQLGINNTATSKSLEKLSSGFRINRAGDDAAGLAISEKMRGQIRGLNMASKNAQDGISLIQTAEGALTESHAILQRMRELAVQSANDTNVNVDRSEIQKEIDQLSSELTRISDTTEFNTQNLLGGEFKAKFHIGANEGQNVDLSINAMDAKTLKVAENPDGKFEVSKDSTDKKLDATHLKAKDYTIEEIPEAKIGKTGELDKAKYVIKDGNDIVGASADGKTWKMVAATKTIGDEGNVDFTDSVDIVFGNAVTSGKLTVVDATSKFTVKGTASVKLTDEGAKLLKPGEYTVTDTHTNLKDSAGNVVATSTDGKTWTADGKEVLKTEGALSDGNITIGSAGIDVSNQPKASEAITIINDAIQTVSSERSKLGAMQNRLEHTIKNLDNTSENLQAAESRIRDVDMAKEMMEFTKQNILQQAATAMLAQANQAPQTVLQLLR
jgi:flagellin